MPPIASDSAATRVHAMPPYQPANGELTKEQLERAIGEFHRREKTWAGADSLRVLVARDVPLEQWHRTNKLLLAADDDDGVYAGVFFEAECDDDAMAMMPVVVDVFISKIASAVHQGVRESIAQDIRSSIGESAVLDLTPAAVVIPPSRGGGTQNQPRSISKRPDLAIRVASSNEESDGDGSSDNIRVVIDIDDHHVRPLDSLADLDDAYFRALPTLQTAVFVRVFRRRISRRFACVAIVMQRVSPSSSSSDGVSGVITDAVGFGSRTLSVDRVVSRIRQLTMVSDTRPIPRELQPLAPHDRNFRNLWAANPSNPANRPFITIEASTEATSTSTSSTTEEARNDSAVTIWLWPIYQVAHERIPI